MRPPRPETELSVRRNYRLAGILGAGILRLWGATWRVEREVPASVRALERKGHLVIHTFWHSHILSLSWAYRGRGVVVLVSRHGDGEYISQIIHRLGYGTVRGSSSRGGLRSLLEMARLGRLGYPLSVTPDGPRGPRRALQPGVLVIAQRSGLPIMPLASAARWCHYLDSWDRFELPLPFSRLLVAVGEPIYLPANMPQEALLLEYGPRVEEGLRLVEDRVDRWAGRLR
jgi:lysophospholipid acyltransferase (LPLAT)-like uncharacterized protein